MQPLPAPAVVAGYFLEARSKILDVAAMLDRLGRGDGADAALADPRMTRLREALGALMAREGGRAERIQRIFSLDYDPDWKVPEPH